jgi:hypothetical protein
MYAQSPCVIFEHMEMAAHGKGHKSLIMQMFIWFCNIRAFTTRLYRLVLYWWLASSGLKRALVNRRLPVRGAKAACRLSECYTYCC